MKGALVILIALILIGILVYVVDRVFYRSKGKSEESETDRVDSAEQPDDECCGRHIICEKNSLTPIAGEVAVYYDDEELDRFATRDSDSYTDQETEEFREVLLTLLPQDVAGWARSLQLRGIELPVALRDELLMIVRDERDK